MAAPIPTSAALATALRILDVHYNSFHEAKPFADATGQLIPSDTKSWSQILICALTGQRGRDRQKGSDLADGSDVKAANCWCAIDTPRFNGCLPAGRLSATSRKEEDLTALDGMPFLYFVLWDNRPADKAPRCRIWVVRPGKDPLFREMAVNWYERRKDGRIKSTNFQLHPPRFKDSNVIRNECGNLTYPLLFSAVRLNGKFEIEKYDPTEAIEGECTPAGS
jgi:hypothetical protein